MKTDYAKKGLAIGIIVLFICVGISSAVAIKGIKLNNNNIIYSSNVESTKLLPNLKITYIETIAYSPDEHYPAVQGTTVGIKNIGIVSFHGYVSYKILIYQGFESSSPLIHSFEEVKRLDIAPWQKKYLVMWHDVCLGHYFYTFVVYVNYDQYKKESDYRTNVALQKFYTPNWFAFYDNYWIKIGFLHYPLLVPHQLGI